MDTRQRLGAALDVIDPLDAQFLQMMLDDLSLRPRRLHQTDRQVTHVEKHSHYPLHSVPQHRRPPPVAVNW